MNKEKLVPFDVEKARQGAEVVTRCGSSVKIVRYNAKGKYPIRAIVKTEEGYFTYSFTIEGKFVADVEESNYDLFIEEEEKEKPRREYSGTDSIYVPKDDEGIREELIDAINGLWDNDAIPMPLSIKRKDAWLAWLQKQGEENPADNKPKFQEGDWVVINPGCNAHQIIRVVENATSHTYGYDTVDDYYFNDTAEGVRLWNITDAKDGDVLAIDWKDNEHGYDWQKIVIFKSLNKFGVEGYGNTFKNNTLIFEDEVPFYSKTWSRFLHPATKEQRDLLFQKMKEAGYEWNSDTKELKKIDADTAEKKIKTRRMTQQEFSWWLRDCPGEHREYMVKGGHIAYTADYNYPIDEADEEIGEVYIRRNGGEWMEPLIEE